ncbi:hypothetical protein WUBG_18792, partial [Wuchereria bancrofti]
IARLYGCTKVIGICGSDQKCAVLLNEWGFNGAINYKQESVVDRLHKLAPEGVDIYFDNVGGFVSDAVISLVSHKYIRLCLAELNLILISSILHVLNAESLLRVIFNYS